MWINQKTTNLVDISKYRYIICIIDNEVYYTDSPFWYWFFHYDEHIKRLTLKKDRTKLKSISKKQLIKSTIKGLSDECIRLIQKYPEKAEQLKKEFNIQVDKLNVR